jgi:hypothetical protein
MGWASERMNALGKAIRGCFAFALLIFLPAEGLAADPPLSLRLVPTQVKQGGVVALEVVGAGSGDRLQVRVGDREIPAGTLAGGASPVLWIGVDLEQPTGPLDVVVEGITSTGRPVRATARLLVLDAAYPVQRLTVSRAFTELDPATLERANREKAALDRLWNAWTPERLWRGPFRPPIDGEARATGFGLRRIINGEPRAPHTGADFAAPAGASVLSANAGAVALAEEHFFAGKSLVLDHGQGVYTMYFHLETILVRPGQRVERGEVVARVGSTGRVTGPHLHWGARLNGARINPEELLRLNDQ